MVGFGAGDVFDQGRGNQIAALGMAVAVVATLLRRGEFHGSARCG